ncbi:SDR family NAD(P)-dependent oxidoreductase [Pseudonocardia acaciae]|uniref:SDR family NAD(P)-dependent oxidoreductase n=1 Tax=Pseudonocardia acaciae TaxID=551276 RepID=UPI000686F241|nr:SDR family NAD(P)-dependent oxidoreductase [Pseudonocardia acaciae]
MSAGPDERLDGAVLVTGGARGIGRAAALGCARGGASVAVLDLDGELAGQVAEQAIGRGAPASVGFACDVRDERSVAEAVDAAADRLGPVRGVVSNAGVDRGGLVHELGLDAWRDVIDTNLTGAFLVCRRALRHMLEHGRGGSIVCVSSPWAVVSAPGGVTPYSSSKGGLSSFVRSVALDYAGHGIRVNAVLPGPMDTALMWANVPEDEVPAMRELIGGQVALGRLGEPDEAAAAITWLLSERSSYVTGSQLVVDGGVLAKASIAV